MALDSLDRHILSLLQENCKLPLNKIGERIGLSAPSVVERIKKLEENGIICGYTAVLDARKLGKDITAFIGVSINHPKLISTFEKEIDRFEAVQECHHVTGEHTLLLKVKTDNTSGLEELIRQIRSLDGVERTETTVVLSTHKEDLWLDLKQKEAVSQTHQKMARDSPDPPHSIVPLRMRRGV